MLITLLILPLLTLLVVLARPAREARSIALLGSVLTFFWGVFVLGAFNFDDTASIQMASSWPLISSLGISFSLGIDSISLLLVLLTVLIMPLAILGSFSSIQDRVREYYAWLLALEAAMLGVFIARDLALFYVAFEFTLLPMFFLIAVYGSANRAKASIVFFLYTFTGSVITLAGLMYVAWNHWDQTGTFTFDMAALTHSAAEMSLSQQSWVLLALCCGLAVKVPLFPVHTWLPLAHTEAPTAGSVVLAAVLLKLGTYGLYRFALPMCPLAIHEYAWVLAILCIIGIIYGALVCWVQRDVKKLIAYSSVSHLGFCVLGLIALTETGISGSVTYMLNHGLSTGALFFCIGMIYERYHTRSMDELGGLARRMPVWTFFTVFFIMASVGLPGLNGFVGEFLCLIGTFNSGQIGADGQQFAGTLGPWYAAVAGIGMILAAVYLLYFAGYLLFGKLKLPTIHHHGGGHQGPALPRDLHFREILVLTPLAILCLVLGVKPGLVLDPIAAPVHELSASMQHHATIATGDNATDELVMMTRPDDDHEAATSAGEVTP